MTENDIKQLHELRQESASWRSWTETARIAAQMQRQMIRAEKVRLEGMVAEAERMLHESRGKS
jgi:hypothetical protein